MYNSHFVAAVLPALNEQEAIPRVIDGLKKLSDTGGLPVIDLIVVCDNGSSDDTAAVARQHGALVVHQAQRGYGIACQTALDALPPDCDIVLFVDADDSCYVSQALQLIDGVSRGDDLAIGTRTQGHIEAGALTLPQRFGNALATALIRFIWKQQISDLGPFRAICQQSLNRLHMQDPRFGWTVEMQVKAIQLGMTIHEYPVDSKKRIGTSKISGTIRGVIGAGTGIIGTILGLWVAQNRQATERRAAMSKGVQRDIKRSQNQSTWSN